MNEKQKLNKSEWLFNGFGVLTLKSWALGWLIGDVVFGRGLTHRIGAAIAAIGCVLMLIGEFRRRFEELSE